VARALAVVGVALAAAAGMLTPLLLKLRCKAAQAQLASGLGAGQGTCGGEGGRPARAGDFACTRAVQASHDTIPKAPMDAGFRQRAHPFLRCQLELGDPRQRAGRGCAAGVREPLLLVLPLKMMGLRLWLELLAGLLLRAWLWRRLLRLLQRPRARPGREALQYAAPRLFRRLRNRCVGAWLGSHSGRSSSGSCSGGRRRRRDGLCSGLGRDFGHEAGQLGLKCCPLGGVSCALQLQRHLGNLLLGLGFMRRRLCDRLPGSRPCFGCQSGRAPPSGLNAAAGRAGMGGLGCWL
jgi:hypothetical protein